MKRRCSECQWSRGNGFGELECLYAPPLPTVPPTSRLVIRPQVNNDDFCSKFENNYWENQNND